MISVERFVCLYSYEKYLNASLRPKSSSRSLISRCLNFQDVSGQVVLITGGGGGVGRFLALNFARLNARIVVWDINRDGKI